MNTSFRCAPNLTTSQKAIIQEENAILQAVQAHLKAPSRASFQEGYSADLLSLREALGEAHDEEIPSLLQQVDSLQALAHRTSATPALPSPLSPYFGHLVLQEGQRTRHVLVGQGTVLGQKTPYPIVDWRNAPLSRIFYTYEEGDEFEEDLGGRIQEGVVLVSRRIQIVEGQLVGIRTSATTLKRVQGLWQADHTLPPQLTGGQHKAIRPTAHLGVGANLSPFAPLPESLPETSPKQGFPKERNRSLEAITALLDAHQFSLITSEYSGGMLVEGGAGSGKTTLALHRMAFLHQRFPQRFPPHKTGVVVWGQALAKYITGLMGVLGMEESPIRIYDLWVDTLRRQHFPSLREDYTSHTPSVVAQFKQSLVAWAVLEEQLSAFETRFMPDLEQAVGQADAIAYLRSGWEQLASWPLARRILRFSEWIYGQRALDSKFKGHTLGRKRAVDFLANHIGHFKSPQDMALSWWEQAFLHTTSLKNALQRLAPEAFSAANVDTIQRWCLEQQGLRESDREAKKNTEKDHTDPLFSPKGKGSPATLDREDNTLLLLLHQRVVGPCRGENKKPLTLAHLVLDEAQEFYPVEMKWLFSLLHTPKSFTLAGDLQQQMHKEQGWKNLPFPLKSSKASGPTATEPAEPLPRSVNLPIGYRSTRSIMDFALAVLEEPSQQPWKATREGAPVEMFRFQSQGMAIDFLIQALRTLRRNEPDAYVAILARYPAQADLYYEGLKAADIPLLRRIKDQDFAFRRGVELSDISQARGLEFDYVILVDVDAFSFPQDSVSRTLLHIAATRAAHQLWLITPNPPSPLLPPTLKEVWP